MMPKVSNREVALLHRLKKQAGNNNKEFAELVRKEYPDLFKKCRTQVQALNKLYKKAHDRAIFCEVKNNYFYVNNPHRDAAKKFMTQAKEVMEDFEVWLK